MNENTLKILVKDVTRKHLNILLGRNLINILRCAGNEIPPYVLKVLDENELFL